MKRQAKSTECKQWSGTNSNNKETEFLARQDWSTKQSEWRNSQMNDWEESSKSFGYKQILFADQRKELFGFNGTSNSQGQGMSANIPWIFSDRTSNDNPYVT